MKKLSLLLLLFIFSVLSVSAQQINIFGRPVGVGTCVDVSVIFVGNKYTLNGLEVSVKRVNNSLMPKDFNLGEIFYQMNNAWISSPSYYDGMNFKFAAVGYPITLSNEMNLGTFKVFVDQQLSGTTLFSTETRIWDGKIDWSVGFGEFKVIQLPMNKFGDLTGDGKLKIDDAIKMWDMLGYTPVNDTTFIISDLSGDGKINDWDVYLLLSKIVDPNAWWPIFDIGITISGSGSGYSGIIDVEWKKISNGKWGLYAKEPVTNGNIIGKNLSLPGGSNFMFKKVNNVNYFAGQKIAAGNQILESDYPDYGIKGTMNNNCQIRVSTITDVGDNEITIPVNFSLEQNYPNPFNPTTTISYQIPADNLVTLKIYDILGTEIATLVNENKSAGKHEVKFDASNLPSGIYLYKISAGNFVQTKKMILMK
ncbi:MAG: T9SS type A sorting domain-containing protein [Candidatus Paceibacterota bacterium]